MRLQDNPYFTGGAAPELLRQLDSIYRQIAAQVNGATEGRISAITNAASAPPTAGEYLRGDFIRNTEPVSGSPIIGWVCTESGTPGVWEAVGAYAPGLITRFTAPPVDDWTDFNLGTSTTDYTSERQSILGEAAASWCMRGRTRAQPVGDFQVTACIGLQASAIDYLGAAIGFRLASSGAAVQIGLSHDTGWKISVQKSTSDTAWSSTPVSVASSFSPDHIWLRIRVVGTDRHLEWSIDGEFWETLLTESSTAHITPDQVFWAVQCQSGTAQPRATLRSWVEELLI